MSEWAECDPVDLMPVQEANLYRDFLNQFQDYIDAEELTGDKLRVLIVGLSYIDGVGLLNDGEKTRSVTDIYDRRFGKDANPDSS